MNGLETGASHRLCHVSLSARGSMRQQDAAGAKGVYSTTGVKKVLTIHTPFILFIREYSH